MTVDPLDPILHSVAPGTTRLDHEALTAVCRQVSTRDAAEFIEAAIHAPGLEWDGDRARPDGYLENHGDPWCVDISAKCNRRALLAIVAAAALVDALRLPFSTAWVARVLPGVLRVRSIQVDQHGVRMTVRRCAAPSLPPAAAELVDPVDFAAFLAAVQGAKPTVALPAGGEFTFLDASGPADQEPRAVRWRAASPGVATPLRGRFDTHPTGDP